MDYIMLSETLLCPRITNLLYCVLSNESEGISMRTLELIQKQKNNFGDTVYYIREENGVVAVVCESEVEGYLKMKGAAALVEGTAYVYPKRRKP